MDEPYYKYLLLLYTILPTFCRNKYPAILHKPRSNSIRRVEPTKIPQEIGGF